MQTLSQVDASDRLPLNRPRIGKRSKSLGGPKDSITFQGHCVKFVKCVNRSSDGTIASYAPRHGQVEVEVYFIKDGNEGKKRAVLVPGINVILSSLPSEKRKINLVTLINFKVKRGDSEDIREVFFYEKLIVDAILSLYGAEARIVTTDTDFDVGCAGVGGAANKWFAKRFLLKSTVQGAVVLREGTL